MGPIGKKRALELLRAGRLPFSFGAPHPFVAVVEQAGVFRVRELVIDPREAETERSKAFAAGKAWMPENHHALGRPTGTVFLEASSGDELAKKIDAYPWPKDW